MKQFYVLFLLIFIFPAVSSAQSNFKPGYAVTINGDTLRGEVNYREWDTNPASVSFKTVDGLERNLIPSEISYFEVTGLESYRTYNGKISHDETRDNRVQNGRDTSYTTGSYFLKLLQKGNVINLYTYVDALKARYFYSERADDTPSELIYRVYYDANMVSAYKGRTVNENTYIQQLSAVALKAGVMDDNLQQMMGYLDYNKPAILKVTSKMNGISGKQYTATNTGRKYDSFDLYAGVGVSAISTKPQGIFKNAGAGNYNSLLPKVVFGFSAYANPNTRKLVFSTELALSMGKYKTSYVNKTYPYVGVNYGFDQLIISLTPQVAYNFYNTDNFKLFAAVGFDVSKYSYSNTYYRDLDGKDINYGASLFNFQKYVNSLMLKAGTLITKKYQVYATYIQGGYINTYGYEDLKQNTIQVGVNYFFGQ